MDDTSKQLRRHNDPLGQHESNPRYTSQPNRSVPGSASDRFRPPPINTSPQTPRSIGSTGAYSGYYQDPANGFSSTPMSSSTMAAYGSEYGQVARQQGQGFGNYSATGLVYNVPPGSAQTPTYDGQQFGSRQSTAMQILGQDVTSTYFGEATNPPSSSLQQATSGTPGSVYQQTQTLNYSGNIMQQNAPNADVSMNEEPEAPEGGMEEKWLNYQRQLGTVFQDIRSGSLESASETLLSISRWLLSQVTELGLTVDDASLHGQRIKLWDDFNHGWLALGQKQLEMMQADAQPPRSAKLLPKKTLEKLGDELVQFCDDLERHGLVDYQYGVWEERIIEVLGECLDLYESNERTDMGSSR